MGLSNQVMTIRDYANRVPNSEDRSVFTQIVNDIEIEKPLIKYLHSKASSNPVVERTRVVEKLPEISWATINEGTAPTRGQYGMKQDTIGCLESFSEVNSRLAKISGDESVFRHDEAILHTEAMAQAAERKILYGKLASEPEGIDGFSQRRGADKLGETVLSAKDFTQDTGGKQKSLAGDAVYGSIYLCKTGPLGTMLLHPKFTAGGLGHQDLGESLQSTGIGTKKQLTLSEMFEMYVGISIKKERSLIRGCDIYLKGVIDNAGAMDKGRAAAGADLLRLANQMDLRCIGGPGNGFWLMNRVMLSEFNDQRYGKGWTGGGTVKDAENNIIYTYREKPIYICDTLINTEEAVAA